MTGILFLGLLIGLAHAFEADHIAAVAALASGQSDFRKIARSGALWGLGHTLVLMLVGSAVLLSGATFAEQWASGLEFLVGLMLLGLGASVYWRLYRDRVHFHRHVHEDEAPHLHFHSHRHNPRTHAHAHPDRAARRSLFVGVMHGLAGSAALVMVAAASTPTFLTGLAYFAVFGLGSIAGMVGVSLLLALPLALSARLMTRANRFFQVAIGTTTIAVGVGTLVTSSAAILH